MQICAQLRQGNMACTCLARLLLLNPAVAYQKLLPALPVNNSPTTPQGPLRKLSTHNFPDANRGHLLLHKKQNTLKRHVHNPTLTCQGAAIVPRRCGQRGRTPHAGSPFAAKQAGRAQRSTACMHGRAFLHGLCARQYSINQNRRAMQQLK